MSDDEVKLPHEFDGLRAVGDWVVAEQTDALETTGSGRILVPEQSRLVVWRVLSVGPHCEAVKVGERILFFNQNVPVLVHDGRTFAMLHPQQIIGVMQEHVGPPPSKLVLPRNGSLLVQ
jgi:hypothetical protein